jgi:hypothetical protein
MRMALATDGSSSTTRIRLGEEVRECTLLSSPTKSTHKKDAQADEQNQANSAATDHGTSKVKPAAPEQQEQDNQN